MDNNSKKRGFIDKWFAHKAYGFIYEESENGSSHFFHLNNVIAGTPVKGAYVLFEQGKVKKGFIALNVEVLSGGGK